MIELQTSRRGTVFITGSGFEQIGLFLSLSLYPLSFAERRDCSINWHYHAVRAGYSDEHYIFQSRNRGIYVDEYYHCLLIE